MIYAMSDLHGEYDKYRAMLAQIHFSDEDVLYILGDVVDRGHQPVEILRDMSLRPNVFPLMGNHDKMALDVLRYLMAEITGQSIRQNLTQDVMRSLYIWERNGAQTTIDGFRRLPMDDRLFLLDYMEDFAPYEVVTAGGRTFVLVHAGLGDFRPDKGLDEYDIFDLAFIRFDYEKEYFGGSTYIVTGHTPTLAITGTPKIYHSHNNICIDCGAVFPGGRLACLCLDTMEEFYV